MPKQKSTETNIEQPEQSKEQSKDQVVETKKDKKIEDKPKFKLPKYLMLAKGAMFIDDIDESSSGVRIFSINHEFVDRELNSKKLGIDKHNNKNLLDYGKVDVELDWYFDTTKIDPSKLSRIITAYNYGILVPADPRNKPNKEEKKINNSDFTFEATGDRVFSGKNEAMYRKLQQNSFDQLRTFINDSPKNTAAKNNLIDMLDYEQKGYNPLNRPRFEVLELLRAKLNEFAPGISPIRVNED